ncbi:MAG: helicase-related protein [Pseudomonadota bacterium]
MNNRSAALTALLGPTNTGKTHQAIDAMLRHQSGMMGFPLRLLARENYDRVVAQRGREAVGLITGEECILPPRPAYLLCTVESLPIERQMDFLAIDEVQLCADRERGHIFTRALLEGRGRKQTMVMGSAAMRGVIEKLLPQTEVKTAPRFSRLSNRDYRLADLPPRTVVVAFSASEVYQIADYLRVHRGGAAVVLGALSPRARNAQMSLYQRGEVDYLVATDAIGMGLNMDVDHVVFAALRKYDGRQLRALSDMELAQIAGRAGRWRRDGFFGALPRGFSRRLIDGIESHKLQPIKQIYWRNSDLDFHSPKALLASLARPSGSGLLSEAPRAVDEAALAIISKHGRHKTEAATRTRLLWHVCQIPNFQKTPLQSHCRFLDRLFGQLVRREYVDEGWIAQATAPTRRDEGEIEDIALRLAQVRTWAYIAQRPSWLARPDPWRRRCRDLEDQLSDTLHERLTRRFVDRRKHALRQVLNSPDPVRIDESRKVAIAGAVFGELVGFCFRGDVPRVQASIIAKAQQARIQELCASSVRDVMIDHTARILWREEVIARLVKGDDFLSPQIDIIAVPALPDEMMRTVRRWLRQWLTGKTRDLQAILQSLNRAENADEDPSARGIFYALRQSPLGARVPREESRALDKQTARRMSRAGVRFGAQYAFLPALYRAPHYLLWLILERARARQKKQESGEYLDINPLLAGEVIAMQDRAQDISFSGYHRCVGGRIWIRIDRLERLLTERGRAYLTSWQKLQRTPRLYHEVLKELHRLAPYLYTRKDIARMQKPKKAQPKKRHTKPAVQPGKGRPASRPKKNHPKQSSRKKLSNKKVYSRKSKTHHAL